MFRTIVIAASAVTAMSMADMTARAQHSTATDFSSAQKGGGAPRAAPARSFAPRSTGGPKNFGGGKSFSNKSVSNKSFSGNKGNKSFSGNKNVGGTKNFSGNKNLGGNKNVGNINKNINVNNPNLKPNLGGNAPKLGVVNNNALKFKPGPGPVNKVAFKPANVQFVKLGKINAPIWNGPKKIWWGNKWKVFVPLTALGVVALGGAYYYPDAYLTVARPYCEGITPDGCRLNWQRIDFEDGGCDWQCVQYCRRPGIPPPARTVAFVAPPPMAQGAACELSIFSEPNFAGTNATANTEQPRLGEIGWQNQIASVRVASGTWDFFSDPEFTGDTMRLQPGEYADLGPQWSKHSGSFMCVQP
jgi:hypothetical protein